MYHFIVNQKSSSGKGLRIWNLVEEQLNQEQVSYKVYFTRKIGHGTHLASAISGRYFPCTIVAIGGDGTVNEVINGLQNLSEILFGYIPTGSGNDLAKALPLPSDPSTALRCILYPSHISHLNLGRADSENSSRRFIVSAGIGFDAAVCHEALVSSFKKTLNKIHLGKLTYVGIALKQLLCMNTFSLELTLDDDHHQIFPKTYFAAFMNTPYEGGGFMFCPSAKPDDNSLDICIIDGLPKFLALCLLPTAFKGKHLFSKNVHVFQCKKAKVVCPLPHPIHTDGESFGHAPCLTFQLEEEPLSMILS